MKFKKLALVGLATGAAIGLASCSGVPNAYSKFDENSEDYDPNYSDSKLYKSILGDFDAVYSEASEEYENLNKRYAEMAIAEAKLLESGVFLPTSTQGGLYALSKVAPKTAADVLWGNDYERQFNLVVADKTLTKAQRDELKAIQAQQKLSNSTDNQTQNTTYTQAVKAYFASHDIAQQTTYTRAYTSDPKTWDVLATSRAADSEAIINTYDGLLCYNNVGNLVPALASSYTLSSDKKTYTFTIRQGVKWVNRSGLVVEDLKAQNFVDGFRHMMDAKGGLEYLVQGLVVGANDYITKKETDFSKVGIKANSDYELEFTLEDECHYFLSMLGYGVFAPLPSSFYTQQGGKYGAEYDDTVDTYKYGSSVDNILYCGPYVVDQATKESKIIYKKNKKYWDAENIQLQQIDWIYNDGKDTTLTYKQWKDDKFDSCTLNPSTIPTAKADGYTDLMYVSDTNATTFSAFINIKRQSYKNIDGAAKSSKSQTEANNAAQALLNKNFRLALLHAVDRKTYNAQTTGDEVAELSLRNTYTPYNFITLTESTTVKINDQNRTFPAGTLYGEIIQAQLDADGSKIKAYDATKGSGDGYDGYYNATFAKEYLEAAISELADLNISKDNPIVIDLPAFTGSAVYQARGEAFKKSIEESLDNKVKVNLVDCPSADDWYNAGYYTETGAEANYDMYDVSGWGPDYGDPSTYLDTFYVTENGAGYMIKCIGLF
jgi:ABC-type oligopeptide transport system substrate-binding subunit